MKQFITILTFILGAVLVHAQKKEQKDYYGSGALKIQGYYISTEEDRFQKVGEWKEYYENGKLKSILKYNEKGKLEGEARNYYETGELKSTGSYKEGVSQFDEKYYYKNGNEVEAVKKTLSRTIKTSNVNKYFAHIDFPAERQSIQLFKDPLKVEDCYFSGIKFKIPKDGYLYWNFQLKSESQIDLVQIISTDVKDDDLNDKYFDGAAYYPSRHNEYIPDWLIQKSSKILKANTEYIIYFKSKEANPKSEILTFELKLSPTNTEKLSSFFKNSFDKVLRDY